MFHPPQTANETPSLSFPELCKQFSKLITKENFNFVLTRGSLEWLAIQENSSNFLEKIWHLLTWELRQQERI